MTKVIISYAKGQLHSGLLATSLSRIYKYANRHGYDLFVPTDEKITDICLNYGWNENRPPSWLKIPIIKFCLENGYDTVLWLDADIFINKLDVDISLNFDSHFIQAFVVHNDKYVGLVPNCGVWLLHSGAKNFLDLIWSQEDFINHYWWEQAANIHLMKTHQGYSDLSLELPFEFNVHKNDIRFDESQYLQNGRFLHATMWSDKLKTMKDWDNNALD